MPSNSCNASAFFRLDALGLALASALAITCGGAHAQTTVTGGLDSVTVPGLLGSASAGALTIRVSADGGTVVGNYLNTAGTIAPFAYRQTTGVLPISAASGASALVGGVSGDGSLAVGEETTSSGQNVVLWNLRANTKTVISLPGTLGGEGTAISTDGKVIGGAANFTGSAVISSAMRLVLGGTPQNLDPAGIYPTSSSVTALNGNGDVAVGYGIDLGGRESGFRWTSATGLQDIGHLNGGGTTLPEDVNAAGDVVVGGAQDGAIPGGAARAFRWTAGTGITSLGTLDGLSTSQSLALGVDASGNVVVGVNIDGSSVRNLLGFRWTAATGMQTIEQWLASKGIAVAPSAVHVQTAEGVSANGNVVAGALSDGNLYIARVVESTTPPTTAPTTPTAPTAPPTTGAGSGMINVADYTRSLQSAALSSSQAMQDADLVMTGAHGNPMRGLISGSQQYVWSTGDWGRVDISNSDHANTGAVEVGYAHGLGEHSMAKLAVGRTYSDQDTISDGSVRTSGTYLLPELISAIPGTPLYGTLGAYYNFGDANVRRGYDNAGYQVHSTGSASQNTWSLQGRIDWLNAVQAKHFSLTPYAAVLYTHSHTDSYTEHNGGFPVHWDASNQDSTQGRLGLDTVYDLSASIKLLGRVEGVHRFDSKAENSTGQILGLSDFSLDGQHYKQNWLRLGAGIEAGIGKGTVSLYGNATTEAETPRYWVSVSYRLPF